MSIGPNTEHPHPAARYGAALLIVLVAAAVRWALQPVMGVAPPYITFYLAVVMAAAFGGFGPGLFATFVGGLLGIGLATMPLEKLLLFTPAEQVRLAIYLLSGLGISLIAGSMHRARGQAREEAARLRQTTEELRLANERLREADRSKDRFLAVLSHELRNSLMPIKHSLQVLDRAPPDGELARRARATIERQIDQMTRLVNDLLDVSRITSDKLDLQHDRIDLRQVVDRTLEDHRPVFEARDLRLEDRLPPHPVWLGGDAARLSQVLGNLLHNAAKFTPGGGEIRVILEQHDGRAALRVRDNGVGIPQDLLPRIFEPLTQAEGPAKPGAEVGLGLGLALVRRLTEAHGGSVEARSEGEGKGAEFVVTLPAEAGPKPIPGGNPAP
ncbi:sensor histidine kinase [Caldimonas tepidiphila]|uniref:sensor histidine kinase n=1 Tax=Caldimonas tepidiphila TaxID=2315841 RepID=UPI000E5C265A|nr:HAMP domain-containing sensor histidine kinase [Caldimonas tepidiphila]